MWHRTDEPLRGPAPAPRKKKPTLLGECRAGDVVEIFVAGAVTRCHVFNPVAGGMWVRPIANGKEGEPRILEMDEAVRLVEEESWSTRPRIRRS